MNLLDEAAWKREFEHVEERQKQRKPKQIGTIGATDAKRVPPVYLATVALAWHKTGTDYEK